MRAGTQARLSLRQPRRRGPRRWAGSTFPTRPAKHRLRPRVGSDGKRDERRSADPEKPRRPLDATMRCPVARIPGQAIALDIPPSIAQQRMARRSGRTDP